jgi:protein-tyrosine phosphatase
MGQGVLEHAAREAGLTVQIDSAGTGAWHVGKPPDPRGLAAAAARGYDNTHQRARQVTTADFTTFDLILAMDRSNLADLERLRPPDATARLAMFHPQGLDVPDPYYGGADGFDEVLDMLESAARHIVSDL